MPSPVPQYASEVPVHEASLPSWSLIRAFEMEVAKTGATAVSGEHRSQDPGSALSALTVFLSGIIRNLPDLFRDSFLFLQIFIQVHRVSVLKLKKLSFCI